MKRLDLDNVHPTSMFMHMSLSPARSRRALSDGDDLLDPEDLLDDTVDSLVLGAEVGIWSCVGGISYHSWQGWSRSIGGGGR